jgi:hypothetical protein
MSRLKQYASELPCCGGSDKSPRPTLRGPAGESSAFDVDPADPVFVRARHLYGVSKIGRAEERVTSGYLD